MQIIIGYNVDMKIKTILYCDVCYHARLKMTRAIKRVGYEEYIIIDVCFAHQNILRDCPNAEAMANKIKLSIEWM